MQLYLYITAYSVEIVLVILSFPRVLEYYIFLLHILIKLKSFQFSFGVDIVRNYSQIATVVKKLDF